MIAVIACPLCDSEKIGIEIIVHEGGERAPLFYCECRTCGDDGPVSSTPCGALYAWNKRALPLSRPN